MSASEFWFRCTLCLYEETWDRQEAARAASVWHIYAKHPAAWKNLNGDRPPPVRHPDDLGHKLEEWERQGRPPA